MSINTLLLIDVQKDFHHGGSLAISGADDDAERIVQFITKNSSNIHRMICTFDSHYKLHIAHPCFWISGIATTTGSTPNKIEHPKPFTIISSHDIQNGIWKPRPDMEIYEHMIDTTIFMKGNGGCDNGCSSIINETTGKIDIVKYCIEYTRRLEEVDGNKFQLCIWPEHCLMGSTGHTMVDSVLDAIHTWTEQTGRNVEYVYKGQNLYTEMYSALAADVPVSHDTSYNAALQTSLVSESDHLYVAGQALSHCVNYTVRDLVQHWPTIRMNDIYVLKDCSSAVTGFESAAQQFIDEMSDKGIQIVQSTDIVL